MFDSTLSKIGILVLALGLAFAAGRYMTPDKVVTQEKVVTETEYITREVKSPDGTIIKEVIRKEQVERERTKLVESAKAGYKVSVIPKYSLDSKTISYAGTVEKRVAGPIFAGIYADSNKNIGLVISLEF